MPPSNDRPVHAQTREALAARFREWHQPAWRVDQLLDWLYVKRVDDWNQMSNLPKALRTQLAEAFDPALPRLTRRQGSADTTQKFLWRLRDGAFIESVLIPANPSLYGERADRQTLCISTQVGCAYGCRFCASGLDGWKRNLGPEEMVGQILAVERWHATNAASGEETTDSAEGPRSSRPPPAPTRRVDNLVVMGMGEPLANYEHLMAALRIVNAPWGCGLGARKITISTSGLVPQIRRLAAEPEQFRLAISLHGATDEVRSKIMPINRKHPLTQLSAACEDYLKGKGRMITFEYILLAGVNDDLAQVRPLANLARRLSARINLIPYNPVAGLPWSRPGDAQCEAFAAALGRAGVPANLRLEKGTDIDAACGQLRLRTERDAIEAAVSSPGEATLSPSTPGPSPGPAPEVPEARPDSPFSTDD